MTEEIADTLRRQILAGELPPGVPLPQNKLAEQFGISTTPVREALRILRQEGLIVGDSHQRVVVFRPRLADLRENYEMRLALEPLATEVAVPLMAETTFQRLAGLIDEMRQVGNQDPIGYPPLNLAFHMSIYEAAERPRLLAVIKDLRSAAAGYLRIFATASRDPGATEREHEAIYAAARERDAERAGELMRDHLKHTLLTVLDELDRPATDGTGG